jgi:hypothetical protein
MSVSLISLVLPAGGAILTIANLYRLRQIDAEAAKRLTLAAYVIVALGYAGLLLSTPYKASGGLLQSADAGGGTVLSFGVFVASYIVQRAPFRTWRKSHERTPTSSWLAAVGRAAVYSLITFVAVVPFFLAGVALGLGGGVVKL